MKGFASLSSQTPTFGPKPRSLALEIPTLVSELLAVFIKDSQLALWPTFDHKGFQIWHQITTCYGRKKHIDLPRYGSHLRVRADKACVKGRKEGDRMTQRRWKNRRRVLYVFSDGGWGQSIKTSSGSGLSWVCQWVLFFPCQPLFHL